MTRRIPTLTVYDPHGLGMAGLEATAEAHRREYPPETRAPGQAGLVVWEVVFPKRHVLAYYTPAGTLVLWVQP